MLPAGTVGFRMCPGHTEIKDEQKLLAWCRNAFPLAVKIRESISRQVILEYVEQTGDLPKGFEIAIGSEGFYIK
jgi:phage host-nuclease inhibitor protein Gam